jgi:hypothetical protein
MLGLPRRVAENLHGASRVYAHSSHRANLMLRSHLDSPLVLLMFPIRKTSQLLRA